MCADTKPQQPHHLRLAPILIFIVSFSLAIPYAITTGCTAPAIGLIVGAFATFVSLISYPWRTAFRSLMRRNSTEYRIVLTDDDNAKSPAGSSSSLDVRLLFLLDLLLAPLSLLVFVVGTVENAHEYYTRDILGTYATLPYLAGFGVHGYLACIELVVVSKQSWKRSWKQQQPTSCPHCRKSLVGAASLSDEGSEDHGDRGTRMSGGVPSQVEQV